MGTDDSAPPRHVVKGIIAVTTTYLTDSMPPRADRHHMGIEPPSGVLRHPEMAWVPVSQRSVTPAGFHIDVHPVTNGEFARFVAKTGYVTVAERPRADSNDLVGGLAFIPGACWRCPEGPGSHISGSANFPVVQIAYEDAAAYAAWARKSLPTQAEWDFAARGGLDGACSVRGEEFGPYGDRPANAWQGKLPSHAACAHGFPGLTPVKSFPPNLCGLYDMGGNVWEWTTDSLSDSDVGAPRKILKGGPYLGAQSYRPAHAAAPYARTVDTTSCHIGFRCIARES
jgi:sulfatase modifying factor 1